MLSDFLTLEIYFGSENSALYFEDLVRHYGFGRVHKALASGDLQCSKSCAGGKLLMWLSSQGRSKAVSSA